MSNFSTPFGRSIGLASLIAAALSMGADLGRAALASIPEYRSHGKGKTRSHSAKCYRTGQRAALKARNVLRNRKAHR
jgi:hypothetical protein